MKRIIIVGAGIGGLIAGNLLTKKGHNVTIFEAYLTPGGYTAGFYRKGYYFESGAISFEDSASVCKAMKDIGLLDQIEFVKLKTRLVSEGLDGTPETYDDFKKILYAGFPADQANLDAFFFELDKLVALMENAGQPMPFLCNGFEMAKAILPYILNGPNWMKLSKQYGNMTTSDFAAKYFAKDTKLFRLFSRLGYPDMPAMFLGAALVAMFTDLWTVKGGMQSWADLLAEKFRKSGGNLRLNSYVDRIIVQNGIAAGVSCQNAIYAADYVIAAGDYKKIFLTLLDGQTPVPQALRDKISQAAVSEGVFTVYLGLNLSNDVLAETMKTPHVFGLEDKPGCDMNSTADEAFFSKAAVSLYSPSMINPRHAPPGKSSLMLQVVTPCRWMNNWGNSDREVYGQLKTKAMEAVIDNASRLVPGLKEWIGYQDAATPLTYERFTKNSDGASSAWSWNPNKKFYKSTLSVNIETPVKNLFIGSCWAMQIGGIPGALAAAYQCAKKIK
ncbi:phytoene desaturase family protein [Acetonema longum]|uniref:Amine oxidase n=1 Tax=Acetonema longum DSM 6540 TaxID=1009370 RepID=F7NN58_9FIRM|nr:NAD(P)/FAD-dependent oxidoreductase [Acetonema longum]EGO62524.1 amine oxidase [Acetonema longum DSM 6540]